MYRIGIVGNGFVGGATALFACNRINVLIYDKNPAKCSKGVKSLTNLKGVAAYFICLPTPMNKDGSCNVDLIVQAIKDIRAVESDAIIYVRSTVPVGFCESQKVNFLPEFLTEANWAQDFYNNENWIVGKDKEDGFNLEDLIYVAFHSFKVSSYKVVKMTTKEAELVKYVRNVFLATKVSFFNEVYSFCEKTGIKYDNIKNGVALDKRIGSSHMQVPGPDGKRGQGGSCFIKDIHSLQCQFENHIVASPIIDSVISRNENIDRKDDKDWLLLKGRAVV